MKSLQTRDFDSCIMQDFRHLVRRAFDFRLRDNGEWYQLAQRYLKVAKRQDTSRKLRLFELVGRCAKEDVEMLQSGAWKQQEPDGGWTIADHWCFRCCRNGCRQHPWYGML